MASSVRVEGRQGRSATRLAPDGRNPFRRRGTACRPLVPHSPCGTPGRASPTPTSPNCIYPFERRLRLRDPEVATANSSWELTVGSSPKGKPAVAKAVIMANSSRPGCCCEAA